MRKKTIPYLIFLTAAFLLVITGKTKAEEIYLKNGQIIEGQILESTEQSIKVLTNGITITYFKEELAPIEEGGFSRDTIYVSEQYGFSTMGPKRWFKRIISPDPESTTNVFGGVSYEKYKTSRYPSLGIFPLGRKNIDTPLALAKIFYDGMKAANQQSENTLTIIEEPHPLKIGGTEAAKFVFEHKDPSGVSIRTIRHCFFHRNFAFSIVAVTANPQEDEKDFQITLGNFKFQ